jgi:transcriptional antiterminator NusG
MEKLNVGVIEAVEEKYKWYAIYCASNQEKATKTNIEREMKMNNLDKYITTIEVPTDKVIVTVKGKKIAREKVLLPCYIFINADISNGEVLPVLRNTKGVLGFINPTGGKTSNKPEALKNSEVEKFLKISIPEENDNGIQFNKGDRVRIIDGAFSSFEGNIDSIDSNKKMMKVLVKIFSRDTVVEVEFNQVDKEVKNK